MTRSRHLSFPGAATLLAVPALCLARASAAEAHAFGQRYDLPLPLELYLLGAGATVAASFLVMALVLRGHGLARAEARLRLLPAGWLTHGPGRLTGAALKGLAVAGFLLIVAAGLLGSDSPTGNIAPVAVWIVWWVGMAFASALLGDLWRLVNPWSILFAGLEALLPRAGPVRPAHPERLGLWPAVALFLVFAWLELLWVDRARPASLAGVILVYSLVTWTGMLVFGRRAWLERGEVFTLVFSLFARFAPLESRADDAEGGLYLRPYGVGLLTATPVSASYLVLVLAILSTVAFDGFVETPGWFALMDAVMALAPLRRLLMASGLAPPELVVLVKTVALAATPLLFLAVYLATARLIGLAARLGGGPALGLGALAGSFVLSLVPIAIAYHVAHYFLYLLQNGQLIIPLISDPLGLGWDLFGTASYRAAIGIMNAKDAWHLALAAIIAGHVVAVYLAHATALRLFATPRAAICSQLPMVLLMVGYTMVSLWILSQPIVA